jgi:type I restriction enzyme S subunit
MLPSNWTTASLGDVAKLASGGTPSRENPNYWKGDIPWFSAKDLKSFQLLDSQEHISDDGSRNGTRVVEAGTILILVRGMTLLKSFPVCMTTRRSAFNQDLRAVIPIKPIDSEFLAYWLLANESRVMSLVDQAGHGTGRLAPDRLADLEIAFPLNITEQRAIAAVLSTWDRGIRQLSDLIAAKLRFKQGLMQQLLTGKRRFPEFRDEWESVHLKDVTEECEHVVDAVRRHLHKV